MLLNFIAFQIGWFACVLGGAHGWPRLGVLVAGAIVALHLYRAARPRAEAVSILLSGLLGFAADSLLTGLGLLRFPSGQFHHHFAPYLDDGDVDAVRHHVQRLAALVETALGAGVAARQRSLDRWLTPVGQSWVEYRSVNHSPV